MILYRAKSQESRTKSQEPGIIFNFKNENEVLTKELFTTSAIEE
jgi:hypothetical protein